ncbi:hypothetical protein TWF281_010235 [Arthrobotrys megalospora]
MAPEIQCICFTGLLASLSKPSNQPPDHEGGIFSNTKKIRICIDKANLRMYNDQYQASLQTKLNHFFSSLPNLVFCNLCPNARLSCTISPPILPNFSTNSRLSHLTLFRTFFASKSSAFDDFHRMLKSTPFLKTLELDTIVIHCYDHYPTIRPDGPIEKLLYQSSFNHPPEKNWSTLLAMLQITLQRLTKFKFVRLMYGRYQDEIEVLVPVDNKFDGMKISEGSKLADVGLISPYLVDHLALERFREAFWKRSKGEIGSRVPPSVEGFDSYAVQDQDYALWRFS